jgi:hypothetical protein
MLNKCEHVFFKMRTRRTTVVRQDSSNQAPESFHVTWLIAMYSLVLGGSLLVL